MGTDSRRPARPPRSAGSRTRAIQAAVVLGLALLVASPRAMAQSAPGRTAPQPVYTPTPAHEAFVRRFVADVLEFTLLHEMGHMMIQETRQRVLGPEEEYAADRFAAAVLTSGSHRTEEDNALVSVAGFWNEIHARAQAHNPGQYNWADIHGQPAQRAFMAVCLLYGSNPPRWTPFARSVGLTPDQLDDCVEDAAKNKRDWGSVITENLNTGTPAYQIIAPVFSPNVAVFLNPVDKALPGNVRAYLSRGRQLTEDSKARDYVAKGIKQMSLPFHAAIHTKDFPGVNQQSLHNDIQHPERQNPDLYDYTVIGDSCLDKDDKPIFNAFWQRESRSIVLCYALTNVAEDIGRQIVARSGK